MKKAIYLFTTIALLFVTNELTNSKLTEGTRKLIKPLTEWDRFVKTLIFVESGGDSTAVGKSNDCGILQITPIYVAEVNRIQSLIRYSLEDRFSVKKSLEMFEIIQSYYNPNKDIDKAISLHNPRAGKEYFNKIKTNLRTHEIKQN